MRKLLLILLSIGILLISSLSLISASYNDNYIYADNGIVVYPTYILRQVCRPFIPCGVERIDIPQNQRTYNYNNYQNNYNQKETTYQAWYREMSSPGFYEVIKDQESQVYNPVHSQNYKPTQSVIIYTQPSQYKNPTPIKHFANTYNTRNNYDSNGNWIEKKYKDYQPDSKTIVIYM